MERVKIGDVFHAWTVIGGPIMRSGGKKVWVCRCVCGVEKEVQQYTLLYDKSLSCGCQRQISEKTKQLLSELRKQRPAPRAKGFTQTEETKAKISEAAKLRWEKRRQEDDPNASSGSPASQEN